MLILCKLYFCFSPYPLTLTGLLRIHRWRCVTSTGVNSSFVLSRHQNFLHSSAITPSLQKGMKYYQRS